MECMTEHDAGYKALFSDKQMVADLIDGFVREPWVKDLDLDTLEIVRGSFVSERFEKRETDVIWRVRFRGNWLYVYLLIEFQSTVDRFMALRLMVYVGLLYQCLVSGGEVDKGELLPPVLPIVLYNGKRCWTAARDVGDLIRDIPEGQWDTYRPRMRYILLEEHAQEPSALAGMENLAAVVFQLEQCNTGEDIQRVFEAFARWASLEEHRDTVLLIGRWLEAVAAPGLKQKSPITQLRDLREYGAMLKETVKQWRQQARDEGFADGIERGIERGIEKGIEKGEAGVLLRQLKRKFGSVPEELRRRIDEADSELLLGWAERVLMAEHLEDVFRSS